MDETADLKVPIETNNSQSATAKFNEVSNSEAFGVAIENAQKAVELDEWKIATKRFGLTESSSKLLHQYRDEVKNLQTKHPEVVGAVVYGSQVKGRANSESDVDSFIYVDTDQLNGRTFEDFVEIDGNNFKKKLGIQLGYSDEKLKDIRFRPISKDLVDNDIDEQIGFYQKLETYRESNAIYPELGKTKVIDGLFHIQIGRGLDGYRAYVLDRFAAAGTIGEKASKLVIESTLGWEGAPGDRKYLETPDSISKAKSYFRLDDVKPKYPLASTPRSVTSGVSK